MKKCGTWLAVLILLLGTGLLGGCSGTGKPTPESVLKKMAEALAREEHMSGSWTMKAAGMLPEEGREDTPFSLEMKGDTALGLKDGLSDSRIAVSVSYKGNDDGMDILCASEHPEKGRSDTYVMILDQWVHRETEIPVRENGQDARFPDWAGLKDALTMREETQMSGGVACYYLEGELPAEISGEILEAWKTWLGLTLEGPGNTPVRFRMLVREADGLPQRAAFQVAADQEDASDGAARLTELQFSWSRAETQTVPAAIPEEARRHAEPVDSVEALAAMWAAGLEQEAYLGSEVSMWGTLPGLTLVREFAPTDEQGLLFNEEGVEIWAQRIYANEEGGVYADLEIRNLTDTNLEVFSERTAINHITSEGSLDLTLAPGEEKTACLYFPEMQGVEDPPTVLTLELEGYSLPDYKTVFQTEQINLALAEEIPEAELKEGGEVVYEDDWIRVAAYPRDAGSEHLVVIPLGILNKSGVNLSIASGPVTIAGVPVEAFAYGEVSSGFVYYTSLSMGTTALKRAGVEKVEDICFTLELMDTRNYEVVKTTEEITIP